ncbi:MAG TPA: Bax inhibitor-1/YccA family protein [Pseudobdellovibrionaceae bacterium]|nr:Bax inhibitor-1/YccA family protein [Pseudobdellovibrionaceae bacterium]
MSNPALNENTWERIEQASSDTTMTIEGTINKTGILIALTIAGAVIGWNLQSFELMIGAMIANLVLALIIIFRPRTAAYLSQIYAPLEGILLGSISAVYSFKYPGIVTNALVGTVSCFVLMLVLYRLRVIQATERFRSVVIAATGAIALTYLFSFVLGFFGIQLPLIHESTPLGILFSVAVTGLAAFNLILDFDMIEQAYLRRAPKYMEWYCGFALLVTLVWLYLEMLRLMGKLKKR